jgi:hypothetical protein
MSVDETSEGIETRARVVASGRLARLLARRLQLYEQMVAVDAEIYNALVDQVQGSQIGLLRPYEVLQDQVADLRDQVADLQMRTWDLDARCKALEAKFHD